MIKRHFLKFIFAAITTSGLFIGTSTLAQETEQQAPAIQEMALGADEGAKVTLIEYASFTCPHCARFHEEVYDQLKADYIDTGKIRFIYREVYFDKYGLWGSMLARCEPTKFWGIAELLYKGQSTWTRAGGDASIFAEIKKIGRLAGISDEKMNSCLQDADQLRALVSWYKENADEHGINSTPSFVLNGKTYSNMPYSEMSALIEEALAE